MSLLFCFTKDHFVQLQLFKIFPRPNTSRSDVDDKGCWAEVSLFKMAVSVELSGATLHLSDVERNPKEVSERGKEAKKQQTGTSRIEICCKTLAFLIVVCLICVHFARVQREGKR